MRGPRPQAPIGRDGFGGLSYRRGMTTPHPHFIGPTLEQLLDQVVFTDPATHSLREEWEQTKAEEQAAFERVCQEQYEQRLVYHRICQSPQPEAEARGEANLLRPMLKEELDARLTERWSIVLRRVQAVLADKRSGTGEEPDTGSASGSGISSGT
jgi:hypothetical protein